MNTKLKNGLMLGATLVTIACVIIGSWIHIGYGFMSMGLPIRIHGLFDGATGEYTIDEKYESLKSIDMDLNIGNINIISGKENKIAVSANRDYLLPKVEYDNGTLKLYGQGNSSMNTGNTDIQITITVADKLDEIKCKLNLGDFKMDELDVENVDVQMDLGDFKFRNSTADKIKITENLGDVEVKEVGFDYLEINQDLGDVEVIVVGSANEYNYDVKASLGSIKVFDNEDDKKLKGGSGSKTIVIDSSLGDITVK